MNKKKLIASVALGFSALALTATPAMAASKKLEKCYGVVKAGKNDCADKQHAHSCAGAAKADGSKDEWILLPEGTCDRIVGGTLG